MKAIGLRQKLLKMREFELEKATNKGQLGKGLQSLLGGVDTEWMNKKGAGDVSPGEGEANLRHVSPDLIDPNPDQPRTVFQQSELLELSQSIRQDGILQPLVVVKSGHSPGRYTLIAGERRLRASKLAGLQKVPVLVREMNREDRLRIALIENIQRSNLNIIEEAKAYELLIKEHGLTQEQCAEKVGKDRATVANALRLLGLPELVRQDLMTGRLSMGHARALASLDREAVVLQARDLVLRKELSVRKTEQLCRSLKKKDGHQERGVEELHQDPDMEYIAENLRTYLRTKVKISGASQRGKIEISYFSVAELERVLSLINKKL